jgi:hypothetical protein
MGRLTAATAALAAALTIGAGAAGSALAAEPSASGAPDARTLGAEARPPLGVAPAIVGGAPQTIDQAPWQVFVEGDAGGGEAYDCGGSILDPTRVVTAAHCVIHPRTLQRFAERDLTVIAGASSIPTSERTAQARRVALVRIHPGYVPVAGGVAPDDVAVITLASALDLGGPAVKAIAMIGGTHYPAIGTAGTISGYGRQVLGGRPDGRLYAVGTTIGDPLACGGEANATVLCIASPSASACEGDSGGPLVAGGVLVGVASFVSTSGPTGGCGVGSVNGYTNLAAPEIALFVQGSDAPPAAPRGGRDVSARGVFQARSAMTCSPGTWSGAPSFSYAFTDTSSGQLLQAGPSAAYTLLDTDAGRTVACQVTATNAGGTAISRTQASPPIALAPVLPAPPPTPRAAPDLRVAVSLSHSRVSPGRRVVSTLRVSNRGRAAVRGLVVCQSLGRGLRFTTLPRITRRSGLNACWRLGTLARGSTRVLRLTLAVPRGARAGKVATTVSARSSNAGRRRASTRVRVVR